MLKRLNDRSGFTLIEVIMALVILVVVILAMANFTGTFVHKVAETDMKTSAIQLAEDRIQVVQLEPDYAAIDGYAGTETGFPTLAGFSRKTIVTQVGGSGQSEDHKKITVTVTGPGLVQPVIRTITVAAP